MPWKGGNTYSIHSKSRHHAAGVIQARWRRRKKYMYKKRKFQARVRNATLAKDPCQYRLYGSDTVQLSQTPAVVEQFSNLKALMSTTNPRFYRTSMKIKAINLNMHVRLDVADSTNQICLALLRHKRSDPITDADIQAAPVGTGPLVSAPDKPFMDLSAPNSNSTSMTGISNSACPHLLLNMFNPKVVDVMKTWTFDLQLPPVANSDTSWLSFTRPYKSFEINHKFNEIWKFPDVREPTLLDTSYPYNNKTYTLIGWSDSGAGTTHPTVRIQSRFSFKDLD